VIEFMMQRREIWGFLFIFGAVVLNWPFLGIFDRVLPAYLFSAWGLLIMVVFFVARGKS
jgi:hypothetical protein